jgi:hypothetical protein
MVNQEFKIGPVACRIVAFMSRQRRKSVGFPAYFEEANRENLADKEQNFRKKSVGRASNLDIRFNIPAQSDAIVEVP